MRNKTNNKILEGKPRRFKTDAELSDTFNAYLQYCTDEKRFANVAGFCAYSDMCYDTYYECKEYYPPTFKKIEISLEDVVLNNKTVSPAERIFYLKNKFGYADKNEITNNVTMVVDETSEVRKKRISDLLAKRGMRLIETGDKEKAI